MKPCIYCGAPWIVESVEIEHHDRCPFVTNLWPVIDQDISPHGFGCTACGHVFSIGEFYVQRPWADGVVAVVCLGCDVCDVESVEAGQA